VKRYRRVACDETALPVGLIISELLTNAVKYAFPSGMEGEIKLTLHKEDGTLCRLTVEDNGVGLPESLSVDSGKSIGLYIVRLLVEQLEGTVDIRRNNGTAFTIRINNTSNRKP